MPTYTKYYKQVTIGSEAEKLFKLTAESKGYTVADATLEDNKYKKFDFTIFKDGKAFMIDVKCDKKDGIVVEFKNCWNYDGWCQLDSKVVLAIKKDNKFIMLKVSDLRKHADSMITDKTVYESVKDKDFYKFYTRTKYGHNDLFMVLPFSSLDNIPHTEWIIDEDLPL